MSDGEQYCSISITVLLSLLSHITVRGRNYIFYHHIISRNIKTFKILQEIKSPKDRGVGGNEIPHLCGSLVLFVVTNHINTEIPDISLYYIIPTESC